MVAQLPKPTAAPIIYPEDDGLPMSDNTQQFRWIMTFFYNLDWLFADNPRVFVAGNLLWYPVEGDNKTCHAPDVLVAFGPGKGERGSYQQWKENNIAPQVVFEILSPSNRLGEMNRKLLFYDRYGVEEYYIYDPKSNDLSGLLRASESEEEDAHLEVIETMQNWTSPRLGIRFELTVDDLILYRPDGEPFASYVEVQQRVAAERERAEQAEERAEQAEERAEQAEERAEQAEERAELLAERLRQLGVNPDEIG